MIGVEGGEHVNVSTTVGSIELKARISDFVRPGTVVSYKGRWPSRERDGQNLNFIHAGQKCDMANSTSVHGLLVSIKPV
jgi:anaerobic selenocysteine-containing dehydrogenase